MGIFDAGYALFEYTNQRIWDIYDVIASTPTIVKLFQQNNSTRRKNRRKERGMIGNLHKGKNTPTLKRQATRFRLQEPAASSTATTKDQKVPVVVKSTLPPAAPAAPVPEAPEKIKKLESELAKLRDEINKLMSNPSKPAAPATGGTCGTISFPSHPVVPQSFVPPNTTTPAAFIPAPPPPPMPTNNASTPSKPRAPPAERMLTTRNVQRKGTLSLAEVLKGASSTNLRRTEMERSPGGTPLDTPKKNKQLNPSDPQDMIAMALRKKFQSLQRLHAETPESTVKKGVRKQDDEWDDDSFMASPEKRASTPAKKKGLYSPIRDENVAPMESITTDYTRTLPTTAHHKRAVKH